MGLIPVSWDAASVCLSAQSVLKWREYERLILSSFEHGDDLHLYYNMLSFMVKGRTLEQHFGSIYFAYLLSIFTLGTSCVYVGLEVLLSDVLEDRSYYKQCAIGFSGVIFALKVLTTHYWEQGHRRYFGVRVPAKHAVWAELVLIQLMVPNASFIGHLSGIIVGVLYTSGPLKLLMDLPISLLSLLQPSEVYNDWGSGVSGRSQPSTGRPYGWSVSDEDYDEAIRRSYETLDNEGMSMNSAEMDEIRRRRLERFSN